VPKTLLIGILVLALTFPVPARAEVVSTSQALAVEDDGQALAVVDAYLARDEVAARLAALGVDPELARLRAASLSATELEELAGRIEEAPAGGDAFIAVLGITFLVLVVLELVGAIDIFKRD
jgi:hypothetical protein